MRVYTSDNDWSFRFDYRGLEIYICLRKEERPERAMALATWEFVRQMDIIDGWNESKEREGSAG